MMRHSALAGLGLLGQYHDHYGMMGNWWWMWVVWLGGLTLLGLLLLWILSGFRNGRRGAAPPPRETPLDILKRRYAAGEITRAEYEQMRQDLEK